MKDTLTYRVFSPGDEKPMAVLIAGNPLAVELKNYLSLNGLSPVEGALWLGFNQKNQLERVIFNNGSYTGYFSKKGIRFYYNDSNLSVWEAPKEENRLTVMLYAKNTAEMPVSLPEPLLFDGLKSVFLLMENTEALSEQAQKAYVYRSRTLNHGFSVTFGKTENGNPVSTGSIVAMNRSYALIGDIYTRQGYRCRGYAAEMLNACVGWAVQNQKTPLLLCRKEMCGFYRKRGFKIYYG